MTDVEDSDRFDLQEEIGRGSMGVVFRAWDRLHDRSVALKQLPTPGASQELLLKREFRAASDLSHPNVIDLFDLFVDPGCFFTMELLRGADLASYVAEGSGSNRADRVLASLQQLTAGLEAIHSSGILHRDLKPSNVFVAESNGEASRVVLLDFGLMGPIRPAKLESDLAGTLSYMSPEQIWGKPLSPASDLYSLAAMIFEALTGHLPYDFADLTARDQPQTLSSQPSGAPAELVQIVDGLLDPAPENRPSIPAIRAALGFGDESVHAVPPLRQKRATVPSVLHDVSADLFVGRRELVSVLEAELDSVGNGETRIVHLQGTSGMGKTALLRHFVSLHENTDVHLLSGRCHPREQIPYKAVDSIVDDVSTLFAEPQLKERAHELSDAERSGLRILFPVLDAAVPTAVEERPDLMSDPQAVRRAGAAGLHRLLEILGESRPTIVWIDDLQWGDPDSAFLLQEILRSPPPRLLFLVSYRDASSLPSGLDQLGAEVSDQRRDISLHPLTDGEGLELATLLLGEQADESDSIARESMGSPFLIGELVRFAAAAGSLAELPSNQGAELVDSLVDRRLTEVGVEERRVLEVVALSAGPLERQLVLSAAGLPASDDAVLSRLEKQCLLSSTPGSLSRGLQVYHDRIGEALAEQVEPHRQREVHGELALVLEASSTPDAEALVVHCLGAERFQDAGRYAVQAAERASRALAFVRAAELYETALKHADEEADRGAIHVGLAESLSNAGRGIAASAAFDGAASYLESQDASHLEIVAVRRRSAEELVKCGEIDDGLLRIRGVLGMLDVRMPRTPAEGMGLFLLHRTRLLWRGMEARQPAPVSVDPELRARIDALWGASVSVGMLNPTLSSALAVEHLVSALDLGDKSRLSLALGNEAAWRAVIGRLGQRERALEILNQAESYSRETNEPYDRGWCAMARGIVLWARAEWQDSAKSLRRALDIYRNECSGTFFESGITNIYLMSSLSLGGEIQELRVRVRDEHRYALERGDSFAANGALLGEGVLGWLADEDVEVVIRRSDEAIAQWSGEGFLMQHYHHILGIGQALLFADQGDQAAARLNAAWSKLRAPVSVPSVPAGRTHVASGKSCPCSYRNSRNARKLALAKRCANALERNGLGFASASAVALNAGIAFLKGEMPDAAKGTNRLLLPSSERGCHSTAELQPGMRRSCTSVENQPPRIGWSSKASARRKESQGPVSASQSSEARGSSSPAFQ